MISLPNTKSSKISVMTLDNKLSSPHIGVVNTGTKHMTNWTGPMRAEALTIPAALEYAAKLIGRDYTLGEAIRCNMNDTDTVSIILLNTDDGTEAGTMEIWLENGRLYGEY